MRVPPTWIKHGRAIGRVAALAILAGAIWVVADQWFGTLQDNGLKAAGNLEHIIRTKLGLTGIAVEPNRPKAGDISVTGNVESQEDADTVTAVIEEWRAGSWPSKIYIELRIGTHNE